MDKGRMRLQAESIVVLTRRFEQYIFNQLENFWVTSKNGQCVFNIQNHNIFICGSLYIS